MWRNASIFSDCDYKFLGTISGEGHFSETQIQVLYNLNMTKTDKVQASIMKGVKQINVVELVYTFFVRKIVDRVKFSG